MEQVAKRMTYDSLPDGFTQTAELNLRNNTGMMLVLNGIGFLLFLGSVIILPFYINLVRPQDAAITLSFEVNNLGQIGLFLLFLAVDFILLVILHEGVHGICFWLITGKRPIFNIGPGYAYAAAPDVFISKKPYLITAISPLIVLTIIGLMLFPFIPQGFIFYVGLFTVMNIVGAVGDLWVAGMLLLKHGPLLIQDSGDRVVFFQRGKISD
jgi:hypothetical protein